MINGYQYSRQLVVCLTVAMHDETEVESFFEFERKLDSWTSHTFKKEIVSKERPGLS